MFLRSLGNFILIYTLCINGTGSIDVGVLLLVHVSTDGEESAVDCGECCRSGSSMTLKYVIRIVAARLGDCQNWQRTKR